MKKPTEDILDALGIQDLTEDQQQEMLLDMQALIFKGSVVRMLEQMSEEEKDAFNDYISTNPSEEEMMDFLKKNVPGASDAVLDTIAELKNDILAVTQA